MRMLSNFSKYLFYKEKSRYLFIFIPIAEILSLYLLVSKIIFNGNKQHDLLKQIVF